MTKNEFENIRCGKIKHGDELFYVIIVDVKAGKTTAITLHNGDVWSPEETPGLIEQAKFIPEELTNAVALGGE